MSDTAIFWNTAEPLHLVSELAAATVAAAAEVPAVGAAAAGDCVPLGPKIIFGKEWSTQDMAAAMAKITELEAATVQLEADKAELEASVRAKDTTLGDVAEISLKVPSTSIVVEETAAVYAARLAQLAARRAKKGAKTVSSAPVVGKSAELRRPKPLT